MLLLAWLMALGHASDGDLKLDDDAASLLPTLPGLFEGVPDALSPESRLDFGGTAFGEETSEGEFFLALCFDAPVARM